ncbi:MAG: serine/threonine-protein kinase [Byssovorax sp.]
MPPVYCPSCHRNYHDETHAFCPHDGTALIDSPPTQRTGVRNTTQRGAIIGGRHVIEGFIGAGGMARVYLATDTQTKQSVAIKILHREKAEDRGACERFLREVEVAATLHHPNLIEVLDAGEVAGGVPYLVLELLVGESLGDLLRRVGAIPPAVALPLVRMAAAGLAAAHKAGIIHRDIKPDNLFLIGMPGSATSLKVVDFGMAKLVERNVTAAGIALGTIEFMAPEQAVADTIDARADIYALGVVLFRMVTGKLPFDSQDDALLVAQQLFVPPPTPSSLRAGLSADLDQVILTMLRKHPDNRYASMTDVIADIDRLLGKEPGPIVGAPIKRAPDVYEPVNPFGRTAAKMLKNKLATG